jgi:hypothetical protein
MQPETEDFAIELSPYDVQEKRPRSLELFEEYSGRNIDEIIHARREGFENADSVARTKMVREVGKEVEHFRVWLEDTENFEHDVAHFYAVSLKSLLLGLPIGLQIASLFDRILNAHARK